MSDLIDRQKVLELPRDVTRNLQGEIVEESIDIEAIKSLPSVESEPKCNSCRYRNLEWYEEPCDSCTGGGKNCHYKPEPERLTDDDFEAIRIHLNAYKEKLCNQRRWEEAEEYQRIIDRFMSFASAEPERKKGKWIDDGTELGCCCSECGVTLDDYFDGALYEVRLGKMPKFCPNCGSYNGG